MKTLAIIPARGGSKGIENKNMALLGGKPLIEHTIDAVMGRAYIDFLFVASDDIDICTHCSEYLNRNFLDSLIEFRTFLLPRYIGQDHVQVDEAVLNGYREVQWLRENRNGFPSQEIDTIIVLQPTSPFRTAQHIDEALTLYQDVNSAQDPFDEKDTVFSVWEPGWSYNMNDEVYATSWMHDPARRLGRQDVDNMGYVTENGAIYIVDAKRFSEEKSFRSSRMIPYYMDKKSSIEIDEPIDLAMAEAILAYEDNS